MNSTGSTGHGFDQIQTRVFVHSELPITVIIRISKIQNNPRERFTILASQAYQTKQGRSKISSPDSTFQAVLSRNQSLLYRWPKALETAHGGGGGTFGPALRASWYRPPQLVLCPAPVPRQPASYLFASLSHVNTAIFKCLKIIKSLTKPTSSD